MNGSEPGEAKPDDCENKVRDKTQGQYDYPQSNVSSYRVPDLDRTAFLLDAFEEGRTVRWDGLSVGDASRRCRDWVLIRGSG